MLIGYARVSTTEQNLDLQTDALNRAGCEKLFTVKAGGARADRPGLDQALAHLRKGDTLVVWKLDRLGRSIRHLIETVGQLQEQKVGFRSLKHLHRLIRTSTVYRQSSRRDPAQDAADSDNAFLGRYPLRRLDAESVRDTILLCSGGLDETLYGPPVPVVEDSVGLVNPANDSPRRSLYLQVRRTHPVSLLAAFDAPVMTLNCDRRNLTTTPSQSLMLRNSEFVLSNATTIALRIRSATPRPALGDQIAAAWRLVYQRSITPEGLDASKAFAALQEETLDRTKASGDHELVALSSLVSSCAQRVLACSGLILRTGLASRPAFHVTICAL